MKAAGKAIGGVILLVTLGSCGGGNVFDAPGAAREHNVAIGMLLGYDSDQNGLISPQEFERAMRVDFGTLDRNDDNVLDRAEVSAENDRRWAESGIATTPIIDWNSDGIVDFTEFAGTFRTTFRQLDVDQDGSLSAEELAAIELPDRQAGANRGAMLDNE